MNARVRFIRFKDCTTYEDDRVLFKSEEIGPMEGAVIGVVVKTITPTYYSNSGVPIGAGAPTPQTFLIIGCDDGKIEEQPLGRVTYLRPPTLEDG